MTSTLLQTRVLTDAAAAQPTMTPMFLRDRADVAIALTWLLRLRWLAIGGQLAAVAVAAIGLGLQLPIVTLLGLIGLTAVSNLVLLALLKRGCSLPVALVPTVLLGDVLLLTAMLAATGGTTNPFCMLYLTHVAMAVVVLKARWVWMVVATTLLGFTLITFVHQPLIWPAHREPRWAMAVGEWIALALTAVLIAYFLGKLRLTLRTRDQQLSRMQNKILRTEQLASLTTLAAGAAHELGTPLGTIALVAHDLERAAVKLALPPAAVEDLKLIRGQVDRCRRILDRMDVENMRDPDEPARTVAVSELVDDLLSEMGQAASRRLKVQVQPGVSTIHAPAQTLVQALQILVQNALDASKGTDEPVTLDVQRDGLEVCIQVIDRGTGMDEQQLRRAGEPFVTSKAPNDGMGLGLFLVRLVAEQLRGSLELASAPGQGTIASLKFRG